MVLIFHPLVGNDFLIATLYDVEPAIRTKGLAVTTLGVARK
jgi:hypothetical protein